MDPQNPQVNPFQPPVPPAAVPPTQAVPAPQPFVAPVPTPGPTTFIPQPVVAPPVAPQPVPQPVAVAPTMPAAPAPVQPMFPPSPAAPAFSSQPIADIPAPKNKKKLVMIVAGVVVVVLIVGGVLIATGGAKKVPGLKTITGTSDVQDRSDGTLDLSNLIDRQKSIKSQDLKAKVKQQVNLSDGTSYMVTSVERNWQSNDKYNQPDAGKEYIRVKIVIGNRSQTGSVYASSSMFQLKNSSGGLQDYVYVTDAELPDRINSDTINAGKQVSGSIIYAVDTGEKGLSLVTNDEYESIGTATKQRVTIKSEVSLE